MVMDVPGDIVAVYSRSRVYTRRGLGARISYVVKETLAASQCYASQVCISSNGLVGGDHSF